MSSRRRVLLVLASALFALALGLFALSQSRTVRQRVLVWAETRLAEALEREVRVGEVTLQPWLGRLELSGVRVARARTLAGGAGFSAEAIRVRWSWTALLRRRFILRQITLVRPRLRLPLEGTPPLTIQDVLAVLLQSRTVELGGWVFRVRQAAVRDGQIAWAEEDGQQGGLEGLEGQLAWRETGDRKETTAGELRAARLSITQGETTRQIEQVSAQLAGAPEALSIAAAEFQVAGARVTARGRIADPGQVPRLDFRLGLQAPLAALVTALGSDRQIRGTLQVDGQLEGPWGQLAFQGEGGLQLAQERGADLPLRFSVNWKNGRLEAEGRGAPPTGESLHWTLGLEAGTGAYRARASVADVDLAALAGLPALAVALAGGKLPTEARGRVTADLDLTGRGRDLAALRGHASLRVDGLGLAGEKATGKLEARLTATTSRLDVDGFTLQLPGGNVQGRGSLRFDSGQLDLPLRADLQDVAGFGRGFGLPFLGGRATIQGRLAGARTAPRLQGHLTWREARIAAHTLDLVEGEIELSPRAIRTSRLALRTGRTTANLRGSLVASGTNPLRSLNPKRDLTLDLQGQVNPARTADLTAFLPSDLEIHGAFRASGRVTGTLQALSGEVELALGNLRTWEESWQRGEALLRFRQGAVEISRISLRRGNEQLSGEIGVGADGTLRGRLTSTTMDLVGVGSLSGSRLAGQAGFRLDLQGTLRETRTLGQATAGTLVYRGIPLGPGTATFMIAPKTIELDLTVREGTHRLQATIGRPPDRGLKAELSLREAELDVVARLREIEVMHPWQGRGTGRILVRGPGDDLAASEGEVDFANLQLRIADEVWESRGPVRAGWAGSTVTLRQVRLRSEQRELDLRGTLADGNATDLLVKGQLPLAALQGYLPMTHPREGLATANLRLRGSRREPTFDGTVEVQRGRLALSGIPAEFREVQATLDLQGNRTEIRRWQAELAEGSFRGTGEIRRRGEQWDLRLTFQEDNGRAEKLLAGLYGGKGEVTGALSLGGILSSRGGSEPDFWRNLDGDLKLGMRGGRIGRYTVVAKILTLLNVAQLLELKLPELLAEGMPYRSLSADIKIQQGIARTENLVLDSQAMKINAVGQVNLVEDTVDLTVAVKPLQTVDRILTKIPLAGWLLGGKEQSLLVAYYQVSGPLSDPQVSPIPLKSVGRNIFGIFRRLLEIPEALTGPFEELPPQPVKPEEGPRR